VKKLLTAVLLFSLAGCESSGNASIANEDSSSIGSQIQVGSTTEDQVRTQFGDPSGTQFLSNGDSVWTYDYTHLQSDPQNFIPIVGAFVSGTNGYKRELVIEFDTNKVVKNYSMNKSPVQTTTGILG